MLKPTIKSSVSRSNVPIYLLTIFTSLTISSFAGSNSFLSEKSNDLGSIKPEEVNCGVAGRQGARGPAGAKGATGAAGVDGINGATGPTGADGAMGATGAAGVNGINGATGPAGIAGAAGRTGATGAAGAKGATGATGPAGVPGAPGQMGPAGAAGEDGVAGRTGATGPAGVAGVAGRTGATGATGTRGATGATGPAGVPGAPGQMGPAGAAGEDGIAGRTGATGPAGIKGATGATGPVGTTAISDVASFRSASTNSIPNGQPIPWTLMSLPAGTGIGYTAPNITIGNAGLYQITYGASEANSGVLAQYNLTVNGVANPYTTIYVVQSTGLLSTSWILQLDAGSNLTLQNASQTTTKLGTTNFPGAFLTIFRLK